LKIATALLIVSTCNLAHADEIAERIAVQRSTNLVTAITKGERDLRKALSYGDEKGFAMEVTRPMARQLQWWHELEQQNSKEFAQYQSCSNAAFAFNQYGVDHWDVPTLARDRRIDEGQKTYTSELKQCRRALKRGSAYAHTIIRS
jgi:hypothetical protein